MSLSMCEPLAANRMPIAVALVGDATAERGSRPRLGRRLDDFSCERSSGRLFAYGSRDRLVGAKRNNAARIGALVVAAPVARRA